MCAMTNAEVLSLMRDDGLLNQIRQLFSAGCGEMEQAWAQRRAPTPIESRRVEFTAASKILEAAQRPLVLLLASLIPPLLDALRNAADLDSGAIYDLLADAGVIHREPYDYDIHGDEPEFEDSAPGDEIWVLTELGKRFAGRED